MIVNLQTFDGKKQHHGTKKKNFQKDFLLPVHSIPMNMMAQYGMSPMPTSARQAQQKGRAAKPMEWHKPPRQLDMLWPIRARFRVECTNCKLSCVTYTHRNLWDGYYCKKCTTYIKDLDIDELRKSYNMRKYKENDWSDNLYYKRWFFENLFSFFWIIRMRSSSPN